ncbi:MAG: alpha amylase family protein [bacterium]
MLPRLFVLLAFLLFDFTLSYSQKSDRPAVLWCDPISNIKKISSRGGIINIITRVQSAGIEAIALGVKCLSGEVLYESKIAPRLLDWEDYRLPLNLDPVKIFQEECRKRKIQFYPVFTIFSEGHMLQRRGPVYNDKPEWQTYVYVVDENEPKVMPITDWAFGTAAFVNPLLQEVQDYEIRVVTEFLKKYKVDNIIFDRIRFNSIESDFSDYTKGVFLQSIGQGSNFQWWPKDVYEWQYQNDEWQIVPGNFFQRWIEFRSRSIKTFLTRLVQKVREVNRNIEIGNLVGAWYPTYYEYGVNWASPNYAFDADWSTPKYHNTSIVNLVDYLIAACYFPRLDMDQAEKVGAEWWMSIEGATKLAMEAVDSYRPVYASVWAEQFRSNRDEFKLALTMAMEQTNGLYIYDLSTIEKYNLWSTIRAVLKNAEVGARPKVAR